MKESSLQQLSELPKREEFYGRYWNKQPFVVRGWLAPDALDRLAQPEHLLQLASKDTIDSKLVSAPSAGEASSSLEGAGWEVIEGPFEPALADALSQPRQSLLVQGVDLHHLPTAKLWQNLSVAPLWLKDNIMASYSSHGGTVGPHVDSYHVFLLQGLGKRQWQVADSEHADTTLIDGLPLKILATGFAGQTLLCEPGDLLYVPPGFCHHGVSIDSAVTYSFGFLGPETTELWRFYAEYLDVVGEADDPVLKGRFRGAELSSADSGLRMSHATAEAFKAQMTKALDHPLFADWLGEFLSSGAFPELEHSSEDSYYDDHQGEDDDEGHDKVARFTERVAAGKEGLVTLFPFKVVISADQDGKLAYQVAGLTAKISVSEWQIVHNLLQLEPVSHTELSERFASNPKSDLWPLLLFLWEEGFITFQK